MPVRMRARDSSLPSRAQSSVAPPGVEALPETATRSGQRTTEFLTPSFAARATSASYRLSFVQVCRPSRTGRMACREERLF